MQHHSWILYVMLPLLLIIVLLVLYKISGKVRRWFSQVMTVLKAFGSVAGITKVKDTASLNESLSVAGYAYDQRQDIFYSILDPWQKKFGYCRLYDEAAAPMGMIIDCEPVYFEYGGKKWLIEFWKGQYDLTTGCEIGVYTTKGPDLNIPGVFHGTFYNCPDESDYLRISYTLKKNGRMLFVRNGVHWWLTGFRLGEFSEPSELTMYINISLKDRSMLNVFLKGLKKTGYSEYELTLYGDTVSFVYAKPYSAQPVTRTNVTDALIQKKNKLLCDKYNEATKGCKTLQEKMKAVQEKAPELYRHISRLGRTNESYDSYEKFWGTDNEKF